EPAGRLSPKTTCGPRHFSSPRRARPTAASRPSDDLAVGAARGRHRPPMGSGAPRSAPTEANGPAYHHAESRVDADGPPDVAARCVDFVSLARVRGDSRRPQW